MSIETKIAGTLGMNPVAVFASAAVAFVACTHYPYPLLRMLDWQVGRWMLVVGVVVALVRLGPRVQPWLQRRRRSRAVACARVVER